MPTTMTASRTSLRRWLVGLVAGAAIVACSGSGPDPTTAGSASTSDGRTDDWCSTARAIREAGSALDLIDASSPQQVEAAVTQLVDRLDEAESVAPAEIADDVAVTAGSAREFRDVLASVGYEVVRADLSTILGPENQVASQAIEVYNEAKCGFAASAATGADDGPAGPDDGPDDGPDGGLDDGVVFDPADGSIRDQAIALLVDQGFSEEQATCLFDGLDLSDASVLADPAFEAELLTRCEVDPSMLPGADG